MIFRLILIHIFLSLLISDTLAQPPKGHLFGEFDENWILKNRIKCIGYKFFEVKKSGRLRYGWKDKFIFDHEGSLIQDASYQSYSKEVIKYDSLNREKEIWTDYLGYGSEDQLVEYSRNEQGQIIKIKNSSIKINGNFHENQKSTIYKSIEKQLKYDEEGKITVVEIFKSSPKSLPEKFRELQFQYNQQGFLLEFLILEKKEEEFLPINLIKYSYQFR